MAFREVGVAFAGPEQQRVRIRRERRARRRADAKSADLRRVESVVTDDPETFAANSRLTKVELGRMRRAGMGPDIYQPTEGPNTRGVTSVTLFASAQGARQWMAQEQRRNEHPAPRAEVRAND